MTTSIETWREREGFVDPPGVSWIEEEKAWNFVLHTKNASRVVLLLYSQEDLKLPVLEYEFDPILNKSGPIWHCRIKRVTAPDAFFYAYRVYGPHKETDTDWHWFDPQKLLVDPYAKALYFPPTFERQAACEPGPNDGKAPLGVIEVEEEFDWEGSTPPWHESDLIIYEMHVRGFTVHPSSGVRKSKRGTFAGAIDKIPYLQELGVTAVELMPVFQFDPQEGNYWGYMPLNFFAPHHGYCENQDPAKQLSEFKRMVKAFHDANIEVILDVVYNHTAEGRHDQPIYSYKGIDNSSYYIPSGDPGRPFADFTGCGNTLDAASIGVRKLIVDSLRHWHDELHVDGFRFDLTSIFIRNSDGTINEKQPPIFGQIRALKGIANARLIAEPWDAAGTYQLGREFPGWLWMQWNGMYRDSIQRFVKGDNNTISELMTRLYGSSDLFPDDLKHSCRPWQSINYISSHDGSSFYDMVSYEEKNNWANGEDNRDGCFEYKWNCGHEGDEDVPDEVLKLRKQQIKNFFCLLMLSNGTPMFRMGDEFAQTQNGNNNPYNQDNETSWLNWKRLEENRDVFRFVKEMIDFRKAHPSIGRSHFWRRDIRWYGPEGDPDISEYSRIIGFWLNGTAEHDRNLYVMINGSDEAVEFGIQEGGPGEWRRVIDTSMRSPQDITPYADGTLVRTYSYLVKPRSIVVLVARKSR